MECSPLSIELVLKHYHIHLKVTVALIRSSKILNFIVEFRKKITIYSTSNKILFICHRAAWDSYMEDCKAAQQRHFYCFFFCLLSGNQTSRGGSH